MEKNEELEFEIYNVNEVIIQPHKSSCPQRTMRTLFEARKVAGSATYNKMNSVTLVCYLFSSFSHENKESW